MKKYFNFICLSIILSLTMALTSCPITYEEHVEKLKKRYKD